MNNVAETLENASITVATNGTSDRVVMSTENDVIFVSILFLLALTTVALLVTCRSVCTVSRVICLIFPQQGAFLSETISNRGSEQSIASIPRRRAINIDERYKAIESGLLSMFVSEHDQICEDVLLLNAMVDFESQNEKVHGVRFNSFDNRKETSEKNDTMDKKTPRVCLPHSECSICLDCFKVGEIVSISSDKCSSISCKHAFHHSCIKEWLLKHDTCPSCRMQFFDVTLVISCQSILLPSSLKMLSDEIYGASIGNKNYNSCFYCVDHGVVHMNELISKKKIIIPTENDLIALRRNTKKQSANTLNICNAFDLQEESTQTIGRDEDTIDHIDLTIDMGVDGEIQQQESEQSRQLDELSL